MAKVEHHGDNAGADAAEPHHGYRVLELDFLEKAKCENACDGAEERREEEREEHVTWVCGAELCAVSHNAHRDKCKSARVQDEEHDLRIACDGLVIVWVQVLELLHGLEAHRGSRIVETEHVRADVHEHRAHDRVPLRDFGEEPRKKRLHDFCQNLDGACLFTDFQDAEPQAQNAREAECDFECRLGHVECTEDSLVKNAGIAKSKPLHDACDKCTEEKHEPNYV